MQLVVRHLVACFVLTVAFVPLLHGIVGQVNQAVGQVVDVILVRACSDVSFFVEVALLAATDRGEHGVCSDVELSSVDQERVVDVALHDAGASAVVLVGFCDQVYDLVVVFRNLDTIAAVGVLTRFYNPNVLWDNKLLVLFLLAISFLWATLVLGLSPNSSLLLNRFDLVVNLLVALFEPGELWVLEAVLDVEGYRQVIKHVLAHGLIVVPHVQQ